jgi:hypothetical protein
VALGRNDPCHCGSGRKYKKCHEAQDLEAARAPRLQLMRNAPEPTRRALRGTPPPDALAGPWEVAVAPFPGSFDDDPAARPVVVMLVAGGFVLSVEMANRPPEEPEALAALMAHEVQRAIEATGVVPPEVDVRQPALAPPLRSQLRTPHRIAVRERDTLPALDQALQGLIGHVAGGIVPLTLLRSQPATWAGWGLPPALVHELFSAAATFHRAAPWTIAGNQPPIRVSRAGGAEWSVVVMGAAGEEFGLSCYASRDDLDRLYDPDASDPAQAFVGMRAPIVSLVFEARADVPRRMRDEIAAARLEVAGARAYPVLVVLNTPGGGICLADAALLRDALRSVPRFVAMHAAAFAEDAAPHDDIGWTDAETGLTCRLDAHEGAASRFAAYDALEPCGPSGPGATPGASVPPETDDDASFAPGLVTDTLRRFREWLQRPASGKPVGDATAAAHERNARLLLEHCVHGHARPITAITEYDLRAFLFDWYPRKVLASEREARAMLSSLRRFFAFLEHAARVECPWAPAILGDTDAFLERWRGCPRGVFMDPAVQAWQQELSEDLWARLLIPDDDAASELTFGAMMGPMEHRLHGDLHRQWLQWRDVIIRGGITAPTAVLAALRHRTHEWATTPQPALDGRTPAAAITAEQRAMAKRLRDARPGR